MYIIQRTPLKPVNDYTLEADSAVEYVSVCVCERATMTTDMTRSDQDQKEEELHSYDEENQAN